MFNRFFLSGKRLAKKLTEKVIRQVTVTGSLYLGFTEEAELLLHVPSSFLEVEVHPQIGSFCGCVRRGQSCCMLRG